MTELSLDRYRDQRTFSRHRWLDIAKLLPVIVLVRFSVWLGGVVLIGRAAHPIAFVVAIGMELFAIERS